MTFVGDCLQHQLTHSEAKLFSCPICPTMFKQKHSIKRHIRRWHKNEKLEHSDIGPAAAKTVLTSMNEALQASEAKQELAHNINVLPQQDPQSGAEFQTVDIQRALSIANACISEWPRGQKSLDVESFGAH